MPASALLCVLHAPITVSSISGGLTLKIRSTHCAFFLRAGGNTMTTEMQEIAITEDKPLLTGQADTTKVWDGALTDTCMLYKTKSPIYYDLM